MFSVNFIICLFSLAAKINKCVLFSVTEIFYSGTEEAVRHCYSTDEALCTVLLKEQNVALCKLQHTIFVFVTKEIGNVVLLSVSFGNVVQFFS